MRIGDAERDKAVAALSDHFAAGRLTREEFDERVDKAMQARFDQDLVPLFVDLPATQAPAASSRPRAPRPSGLALAPLIWFIPMLVVGLVFAVLLLRTGWPLWGVFWLLVIARVSGRRRGGWPRR